MEYATALLLEKYKMITVIFTDTLINQINGMLHFSKDAEKSAKSVTLVSILTATTNVKNYPLIAMLHIPMELVKSAQRTMNLSMENV